MGCCESKPIENEVVGLTDLCVSRSRGPPVEHVVVSLPQKINIKPLMFTVAREWSKPEKYQSEVAGVYQRGYRLLEFLTLPLMVADRTRYFRFQAILCKDNAAYATKTLKFVSTMVTLANRVGGIINKSLTSTLDTDDLFRVLSEEGVNGSRLIGLAQNGFDLEGKMMTNKIKLDVHIDMMFEVPQHVQDNYVYDIVTRPITVIISAGGCSGQQNHDGDFLDVVTSRLSQGWKLVTITLFDPTTLLTLRRSKAVTREIHCMWIFEKPASLMDSSSPMYEYYTVGFDYYMEASAFDSKPLNCWNATVEEMGRRGWCLASILPTPTKWTQNLSVWGTKVLLIFQRPYENH